MKIRYQEVLNSYSVMSGQDYLVKEEIPVQDVEIFL